MATIEIRWNGTDITSDVIYSDAQFTSMANGNVGTCDFRVRDLLHIYHEITIGDRITLDINGVRSWTGYVKQLNRGYFFEARDCVCPGTVPIYYRVVGSDINVLLNQRYLFDPDNPEATDLFAFPAETPDDEVIEYYVSNYLDLTGDGIDFTSLVDHVGTPSLDTEISGAVGMTWNQFMTFVAYNTGSIWYIDPDRNLVYCDVDTPNAPFEVSDQPTGGQVGPREYSVLFDGTRLRNDALVWGAGKGSNDLVFARVTDDDSVDLHGRWQVGRVVGGMWKQTTANRTANTYVNGSPQSKRGGKIDRHSADFVTFEHGLRVAQKVHVFLDTYAYDEVIPIRVLQITFPTDIDVRYQVTLAHEIDEPEDLTDPFPRDENHQICSIIHCGPYEDPQAPLISGAATLGAQPSTSIEINKREGANTWHVSVSHLCQPNNWWWENDPDSTDTTGLAAGFWVQWSDLYGYTTLPGVLCQKGEVGFQTDTRTTSFRAPAPGISSTDYWYGIATIRFRIEGFTNPRPWDASRPIFPFTHWNEYPLPEEVLVAFGVINTDETELPNEAIWPSKVITTEGAWTFREDGVYLQGERYADFFATGEWVTARFAIGRYPSFANLQFYTYFPFIDFANAAGRVYIGDFAYSTLPPNDTNPGPRLYVEWYPSPGAGVGIGLRDDPLADCQPHCINLGENCEEAERVGRRSYRVLGRYADDSTRVSVNGIAQQLGTDYFESDPDNGVITFAIDIAAAAYVFVCYTAYSIANQIPSVSPTDNILLVPVSGPITGTFGPQADFWPAMVWHGIYYEHFHNGVDFGVASGTPVYASADGVVAWEDQEAGGTMIHIYHDSPATPYPMRTTYAHLSARTVADGALVSQGQHIGYSGASGNVTGAHLHWGLVMYGWPEDALPWSNTPRVESPVNIP